MNEAQETKSAGKLNRALFVVVLLVCAGAAAWWVEAQFGFWGNTITGLFGPPIVQLSESYTNDSDAAFDHSAFDQLLQTHVDADGWVDYAGLKAVEAKLDAILRDIQLADIETLGRDERLAFLLNSYNAFTLKLIVENYPIDSIKEIAGADRWDAIRWKLAGQTVSLNQIEHELIRPHFVEPRIHFALVCAAVGCPPLRNEAYSGRKLEDQLADQSRYVHAHDTWFRHDRAANKIYLTRLYNWYESDFVQAAGSVIEFIRKNSSQLADDDAPEISWLDYDWALNDIKNKADR